MASPFETSSLTALPSEIRASIWYHLFAGLPIEVSIHGNHDLRGFPIQIVQTCRSFSAEAKVAILKHLGNTEFYFYYSRPCINGAIRGHNDDKEDLKGRQFLELYGSHIKKVIFRSDEDAFDDLDLGYFPNLEILELDSK